MTKSRQRFQQHGVDDAESRNEDSNSSVAVVTPFLMKRDYYSATIERFLYASPAEIIGSLAINSGFAVEPTQRDAWLEEITILKTALRDFSGQVYFEYSIPRMGRRIDVVLLIESALFVLEFKIGEHQFTSYAINQANDYALDLKNFHETSRDLLIAPIVIATNAVEPRQTIRTTVHNDRVLVPMRCTAESLPHTLRNVLDTADAGRIDATAWERGRYSPTPTIIEAAMALYNNHSVAEISRSDAAAINLTTTSAAIAEIIENATLNGMASLPHLKRNG